MKTESSTTILDQITLDRLVDGELTDIEFQRLVARLDNHPDQWRTCALAFLERTAWERDFGFVQAPRCEAELTPSVASLTKSRSWIQSLSRRWMVSSACVVVSFAIAFVLGYSVQWANNTPPAPIGRLVNVAHETVMPLPGEDGVIAPSIAVSTDAGPSSGHELTSAHELTLHGTSPQGAPSDPVTRLPSGSMTMIVGDNQTVELPYYHIHDVDQQWLESQPQLVPMDVKRAFEESGHRVVHRQGVAPVLINDEYRLWLPVEEVEIAPPDAVVFQ